MDTILGKGRAGKRLTAKSMRCRKERVNLPEQFVIPESHNPSAPGFRQCCRLSTALRKHIPQKQVALVEQVDRLRNHDTCDKDRYPSRRSGITALDSSLAHRARSSERNSARFFSIFRRSAGGAAVSS